MSLLKKKDWKRKEWENTLYQKKQKNIKKINFVVFPLLFFFCFQFFFKNY